MATITFEVPDEDVRRIQRASAEDEATAEDFQRSAGSCSDSWDRVEDLAKAAVLRVELPWEPSEQDVTDGCEAMGWNPNHDGDRGAMRLRLVTAHRLGWDAVPRRIGSTDG